jgi:aryl-alcohol dehydrogenase-like predicted oxidoreductase
VGTYKEAEGGLAEAHQEKALGLLLASGCNVIDTAPNYGSGNAEAMVGRVLSFAFQNGTLAREQVFVATKAGLAPEGFELPPGLVLGPEGSCFSPWFLRASLEASLGRVGLLSVDCVFLHNLELLLPIAGSSFRERLSEIMECMERLADEGLCGAWGISSWRGFRVPPEDPEHIPLDFVLSLGAPRLRFLQLPFGLWGPEALIGKWQNGESALSFRHNLSVFANSPLFHGGLVPLLGGEGPLANKAVLFVRDTKGVDVALLGISNPKHVGDWLAIRASPPSDTAGEFVSILL